MEQVLDSGRKQASKAVSQSSDIVKNLVNQDWFNQAQKWFDSAETVLTDVAKKSSTMTKRYPIPVVLGAVVAGYLCAMIFRRRI